MILGRFDEAKKILDAMAAERIPDPFQVRVRYRIAFFENDTATMEQLAREIPANDALWLQSQKQLAFYARRYRQTPFVERNPGETTEPRETDGERRL